MKKKLIYKTKRKTRKWFKNQKIILLNNKTCWKKKKKKRTGRELIDPLRYIQKFFGEESFNGSYFPKIKNIFCLYY